MDSFMIGKKLIQLRENKKETQEQVAKNIGTSVAAIGMYERGERIPRDEIKIKIASYFNVSVESIFFDN